MIDTELAAFLESGLAIHMATRDADLEPDGARITAVRVDPDGGHLTVYVPQVSDPRVMANLSANGHAAVCFVRPIDERACQIKAEFVSSAPAGERERASVEAQWEGFVRSIERIGLQRALTEHWRMWPCHAVRLRVTAIYNQTPGPKAGTPISLPAALA